MVVKSLPTSLHLARLMGGTSAEGQRARGSPRRLRHLVGQEGSAQRPLHRTPPLSASICRVVEKQVLGPLGRQHG